MKVMIVMINDNFSEVWRNSTERVNGFCLYNTYESKDEMSKIAINRKIHCMLHIFVAVVFILKRSQRIQRVIIVQECNSTQEWKLNLRES